MSGPATSGDALQAVELPAYRPVEGEIVSPPEFQETRDAVTLDVRPIRQEELEGALPLIAGYQEFYRSEPLDDRNRAFFARFIEPSDEGLLLGAWGGDELVGFAAVYWFFSSTAADDVVRMQDLFGVPGRRGQGVGRGLIDVSRDV